MAPDTSVNKPSTRVTLTRATPTLYNQSILPQLQIRTQVHHGLILKRAMLAFSTSNTVQCDSGKAKTFQKPYTHAPLIPPPSSWKQPFLGMKDLALDFPVPHFLIVITRTSHSCITGMDNKEIIMKSNTEPYASLCTSWSLKPLGSRAENSLWMQNVHTVGVAQMYLNPRTLCFLERSTLQIKWLKHTLCIVTKNQQANEVK